MSQSSAPSQCDNDLTATDICSCLEQVLEEGTEPERCLALPALGQLGGSKAIELLIAHLRDPDPDVRSDAALTLAKSGDSSAIPHLLDNLREDPVGDVKESYVKALQKLAAHKSTDLFCLLATGRGKEQGIAWDNGYTDWDDWLDVQYAVIQALGVIGDEKNADEIVAAIVTALNDPEGQNLWAMATRALAQLGENGCRALGALIPEATALERKRIGTALADSTCSLSVSLLEQLVRDEDIAVRIAAVTSAASRKLEGICRAGLQDASSEVRSATLAVYEDLGQKELATAMDDVNPKVRIAACKASEKLGRPQEGLGLGPKIKHALRRASPEELSVLVAAIAVTEPAEAVELIEDMANHAATSPVVRCACLRALGQLNSAGAVGLLSEAASDARRDIRLEAVAGLGRIAKSGGEASCGAVAVLASAITGELVVAPPGWQPEEGKVLALPPKHGARDAGQDSSAGLRIDREGNLRDEHDRIDIEDEEAVSKEKTTRPTPISTLGAILDFQPAPEDTPCEIQLDEEALAYLELTNSRPGRRKVSPDETAPAHIDVRCLAARIAGETGKAELVPALASAVTDSNSELCEASMVALQRLSASGVDIAPAEEALLQQSSASDQALRYRTISTLGGIQSELAAEAINCALSDTSGAVRAAGVEAATGRDDFSLDHGVLCSDTERRVRLAAARSAARLPSGEAVPVLLDFTLAENAVHKHEAAQLLSGHGSKPVRAVLDWIAGSDRERRLIGLEILPILIEALDRP